MSHELYFLRSSESKIVKDMVKYANKKEGEDLSIYTYLYGLVVRDLGLYVLLEKKVAGAIWLRELNDNKELPILSLAILPEFENKEIDSIMMTQFLQEAAAVYEQIAVHIYNQDLLNFYESFGFVQVDDSSVFIKKLEKKEVVRPNDGYDPRKWMD